MGYKRYLDQHLKPSSFVYWQQQIYQVEQPDETELDPLTIWLRNVKTKELQDFRLETLLLCKGKDQQPAPIFAPTLAALEVAIQKATPCSSPIPETSLPEKLRQRANKVIEVVETVERLVQEAERLAQLRTEKIQYVVALKQACSQLAKPVSLSTYYKYRTVYRRHNGDRGRIAASFRRKTFNQTKLSQAQLHFIDTIILHFYGGKRTLHLRPQALYKLAGSILKRTDNLWLDPQQCSGEDIEHVVEELLDPRLPMLAILSNPEKVNWFTKITLPSQSWFYRYLRWFEAQPDEGQAVIVKRYGREMWEREYMVFDTFANRAVRPLEYVFADHWLVDVFIVDEHTRRRLDRLWLTLLIDTYSRSVLGLALLYEAPCIESIQCALRHAIWPKSSHQALGIKEEWVCYGIPQQLSLDNAWAHHSYSLEQLSRAISQGGQYNSIDLIFRPPYRGRYGALIERLIGNFSGQMKELLPGAIVSSQVKEIGNAARQACLLYQDVYQIIHQLIIRYQHTPHHELEGLTPHQKWLEGWQLGYGGWPPPLTEGIDRLFWYRSPQTRMITRKGISAFGLHYWSPELGLLPTKDLQGRRMLYGFSYDPADISHLALFRAERWVGDVSAKELRRADGSTRPVSLWERKMAQALARDRGQASQDWLNFVTELDKLSQQRIAEKRTAKRQAVLQPAPSLEDIIHVEPDYTELLLNFISEPASGGTL